MAKKDNKKKRLGERIVRSYSIKKHLFDAVGDFAELVKDETGMSCDRSKLIAIMYETLIELDGSVKMDHIETQEDLRIAINKAISEKYKKKGSR